MVKKKLEIVLEDLDKDNQYISMLKSRIDLLKKEEEE